MAPRRRVPWSSWPAQRLPGLGEVRVGSYCLVDTGFLFRVMKNLERDSSDGCTALWTY